MPEPATIPRTDAPPADDVVHITAVPMSDGAWAIACALGSLIPALCGLELPAVRLRRLEGRAVCDTCDVLARGLDLEVCW